MKPENEKFNLLQLHFHWRGSEHLVNGRKFAAEIHMVHKSAVNEGRFAVLGFFIEVKYFFINNYIFLINKSQKI